MNFLALNHHMLSIYWNMSLNYFRFPQTCHFWPPNTKPLPGTWILPLYGRYSPLRCSQVRGYVNLMGIKISLVNELWKHPADNKSILKPQRCITSFTSSKNMRTAVAPFFLPNRKDKNMRIDSLTEERYMTAPRKWRISLRLRTLTFIEMFNCSFFFIKVPYYPLPFVSADYCTRGNQHCDLDSTAFRTQEREMWDKALRVIKTCWLIRNKS